MNNNSYKYDDIINLPHHVSSKHSHMSAINRAAQFSPFAALTGYDEQIQSTQHSRCNRIGLSDDEIQSINSVLVSLRLHDLINVVYFFEDYGTDGAGGTANGEYLEISGEVVSLIPEYRSLRVNSDSKWADISFEDIIAIKLI